MVNSSFMGKDLIIPITVQEHLTPIQKIYLTTCLQASVTIGVGTRGARGAIAPPLFQEQGKIYC